MFKAAGGRWRRDREYTRMPKSDIEIAREAKMMPIGEIGSKLGMPQDALLQYGPDKAKISFDYINSLQN